MRCAWSEATLGIVNSAQPRLQSEGRVGGSIMCTRAYSHQACSALANRVHQPPAAAGAVRSTFSLAAFGVTTSFRAQACSERRVRPSTMCPQFYCLSGCFEIVHRVHQLSSCYRSRALCVWLSSTWRPHNLPATAPWRAQGRVW